MVVQCLPFLGCSRYGTLENESKTPSESEQLLQIENPGFKQVSPLRLAVMFSMNLCFGIWQVRRYVSST